MADFNGDGVPDLVVAHDRTNANGLPAASVLPGLGLGRFGAPIVIPNQNGARVIAGAGCTRTVGYRIATGATVDPVPPLIFSGCIANANS